MLNALFYSFVKKCEDGIIRYGRLRSKPGRLMVFIYFFPFLEIKALSKVYYQRKIAPFTLASAQKG